MSRPKLVELQKDPVRQESVVVKWNEPQLPNRPESSHMVVVGAYFDFARNLQLAERIADLLETNHE